MLSIDMGGTKTAILFETKDEKKMFEREMKEEFKGVKEKKSFFLNDLENLLHLTNDLSKHAQICVYSTKDLLQGENFFYALERINEKTPVLMSYPHTVCKIESEGKYMIENFSKFSVPFKIKVDLSLMLNDLVAFTFFHAYRFFEEMKRTTDAVLRKTINENLPNPVVGVQIGTGLNAFWITLQEFENGSFMKKIVEAGHMTFVFSGLKCSCGRVGCAEQYLSGGGIEAEYKKPAKEKLMENGFKEKYEEMLSMYLSSLVLAYDPIKMVVGGSLIKSVDKGRLKNKIYESLNAYKDYANAVKLDRKERGILKIWEIIEKTSEFSFPLPIEFDESFFPNIFGVYLCYSKYFKN